MFLSCKTYYYFNISVFADLCQFSPCENGATCIVEENRSTFTCLCIAGFVGKVCHNGKLCDVSTSEWHNMCVFLTVNCSSLIKEDLQFGNGRIVYIFYTESRHLLDLLSCTFIYILQEIDNYLSDKPNYAPIWCILPKKRSIYYRYFAPLLSICEIYIYLCKLLELLNLACVGYRNQRMREFAMP